MASRHPPPPLDLHSGKLYWLLRDGLGLVVPPLRHDVSCDVAVLGSGITGALMAEPLAPTGSASRRSSVCGRVPRASPFRGAIHSRVAAQIDPYRFCLALLARARALGARIHDRTTVASLREERTRVKLHLACGATVTAQHVVCATGDEAATTLPRGLVRLISTYVAVSEPVRCPWRASGRATKMWEMADPYVYVREVDGRLMIGGADEEFVDDRRRDRLIPRKTRRLMRRARLLFPACRPEPAFAWAGTLATTEDGLGFVGPLRQGSRVLYALGFGGNGITGSAMACAVLTDLFMGRPNGDAARMAFDRPR